MSKISQICSKLLLTFISVGFLAAPHLALAERPDYPVIFIHGLFGGADSTWKRFRDNLIANREWKFGGSPRVIDLPNSSSPILSNTSPYLTAKEDLVLLQNCTQFANPELSYCSNLSSDRESSASFLYDIVSGDFYTLEFSSGKDLTFEEQGWQLAQIIKKVRQVNNNADKVLLVAHSMGGLAARAYLQNFARRSGGDIKAFSGDVEALITIGTPHSGAMLPFLVPTLISSVATRLLEPDSPGFLGVLGESGLNTNSAHPIKGLPLVDYISIIVNGTPVVNSFEYGDGVVSERSQDLGSLALLPVIRNRHQSIPVYIAPYSCINKYFEIVELRKVSHTCETDNPVIQQFVYEGLQPSRNISSTVISQIALGSNSTFALTEPDGGLWAWGYNRDGRLGLGSNSNVPIPSRIGADFKSIVAGEAHVFAEKKDGSLWAWGLNSYGQLGDGTTRSSLVPKQIFDNFSQISPGHRHTVALKSDGSMWAWGSNSLGQLGDGTTLDSLLPKRIGSDYIFVSSSFSHNVAIKSNGTVWAWGDNEYGQLGDGTTVDSLVPKQIGSGFTALASGYRHTLALDSDGNLWSWGDNTHGQLGNGTTIKSLVPIKIGAGFTAIAVGNWNSVALKSDGSLWAWGVNNYGQLGDGTTRSSLVPKQIDTGYSKIGTSQLHTVGIKFDNSMWSWGFNGEGELGDGTWANKLKPVQIGSGYAAMDSPLTTVAQTSGPISNQLINFTVTTPSQDVGKRGSVFLAAILPPDLGGGIFLGSAFGWFPFTGCDSARDVYQGVLRDIHYLVQFDQGIDFRSVRGATFYAGYGTGYSISSSCANMIERMSINKVYTIN